MKYKPHEYQKYAINFIIEHPVSAIFLDCGLGKTSITLTALNELTGTHTLYYGDSITDELLVELGFFDAEGNDVSDYSFKYSSHV